MSQRLFLAFLALLLLPFAPACSSGGSSGLNSILTALQDLGLDPTGRTTVLTFKGTTGLPAAATLNFEADGGQTATSVVILGAVATVTWDERVTPSHDVRATGLTGVAQTFKAVTTSDSSAPTFTITDADQVAGLGGDTLEVTFSGPRVVTTQVTDPATWTLRVNGQALDLTGSVFDFDPDTQVLDVTLGTLADLHASFTFAATGLQSVADVAVSGVAVAGNATGDSTAPTLVSAEQNLAQDEFGRVIDFTFSEAMSPVFSVSLSQYTAASPDVATSVTRPSPEILRVTFNNPMVPGFNQVTLTGIVDAHGNAFPDGAQPITQSSPVANAYDGTPLAVTVPNTGGDYVEVRTTQAFDPDSAADPTSWSLTVDGSAVDLSLQTLDYDLLTKTLTITLAFDMTNGDSFSITGNSVREVDGQTFSAGQVDTVSGETTAPSVVSATQNRNLDSTGRTVDVQMSEDVELASAETLVNWDSSGAQNVLSATRMPSLSIVRLVFDGPMIPGDVTLTASGIGDLAGNFMPAPQPLIPITSTDTTAPTALGVVVTAIQGANDDLIELTYSDDMIEAEVENTANWSFESPIGTPVATAGGTVDYDAPTRRVSLMFTNGVNLRRDDDFRLVFSTMRDLGGNAITGTAYTGPVDSESTLPEVHTVVNPAAFPDQLIVRFTEPCGLLEDLYDATTNLDGTRYVLRDSLAIVRGAPTSATTQDDGLGVSLTFGFVVNAGDTLDVLGVEDLAGNPMFPALLVPYAAQDTGTPSLFLGASAIATVSGEDNDLVTVEFDRPMSPWKLLEHLRYALAGPGGFDLRFGTYSFDGTDTVTIRLRSLVSSPDLETAGSYDLSIDGVWSAHGTQRTVAQTEVGIVAAGDATAPDVLVGKVRLDAADANALFVEYTEAMHPTSAATVANYDYDGGNLPLTAQLLTPRVVRLTFAVVPAPGQMLSLDVKDRAGNSSGLVTRAVAAADTTPPLVAGVSGAIEPGYGGDEASISFDEPVDPLTALSPSSYVVKSGTATLSLSGALFTYVSATHTVRIRLAGGVEFDAAQGMSVTVTGVEDTSGNAIAAPVQVAGAVAGDVTAPGFASAFVNWRADPTGRTVDVLFTEDVDSTFTANALNWTATGGPSVTVVTLPERDHARVVLTAPLGPAATLGMNGVPDLAKNASGAISIDPVE